MIRSLEVSGKQFSAMGKYEQMAFASAAGIRDLTEANKIFGTSSEAYTRNVAKAKAATMAQKDFREASKEAHSVMEKFTMIMKNFGATLKPVIEWLGKAASWVLELQEKMENWQIAVGGIGLALGILVLGLKGAAVVAGPAGAALGAGLAAAGTGAMTGSVGMLAFGLTAVLVGAAIWLFSKAMTELGTAFTTVATQLASMETTKMVAIGSMVAQIAIFGAPATVLLFGLAAGFVALAKAIWLIPEKKLDALKSITSSLKALEDTEGELKITKVVKEISSMNQTPAAEVKELVESIATLNVVAGAAGTGGAAALDATNRLLKTISESSGKGGGGGKSTNNITNVLDIDGQRFMRWLASFVTESYDE